MGGKRFILVWFAVILPAVASGCSVYDYRYSFVPRPAEVQMRTSSSESTYGITLVSIMGVRRPDREAKEDASVEARLLIMNRSDFPISFDPASLALVSADLVLFQRPRTDVREILTVEPRESMPVTALFSFPEGQSSGDVDLSSLNLSWDLQVDSKTIPSSITVTREYDDDDDAFHRGYYHPYAHGRHGFGYPHRRCW